MSDFSRATFFSELEEAGEAQVRIRLASGKYGRIHQKKALAEEWLRDKAEKRDDDRYEESIEISAESLKIARHAKNAAVIAAIMATVAVIWAIVTFFLE